MSVGDPPGRWQLGRRQLGRWHYRGSLAGRVTMLTTIAVGLSVTIVALGAYVTVRMQLQSSLDETLVNRAEKAAAQPALEQITNRLEIPAFMLGAADVKIAFVNGEGAARFLAVDQSEVIRFDRHEFDVAAGISDLSLRTVRSRGIDYRVVAVPSNSSPLALVIAQSLEPQEELLTKLGVVTLLFGLAGIVGAGIAGWAVARSGLRPVRRLTGAAEEITRTHRLAPIPVEGGDEVARLASAFNQMLASLAALRDRERRLIADAGHELRTPLTSLRTNIELLCQADDSGTTLPAQARAELLGDVRAQLEELSTLVGDLVELARDEPSSQVIGAVELHEVLEQAVVRVRRRAPSLRFEVAASRWYVEGEAGALERALTNLLDNAAKWSPAGSTVRVALDHGVITVEDEGFGIAEADLPHVFERFYRSSESRSMPGSGLGLSIVAQVAERHGGSVQASNAAGGGARLTFAVPGATTPKPPAPPRGIIGPVEVSATPLQRVGSRDN